MYVKLNKCNIYDTNDVVFVVFIAVETKYDAYISKGGRYGILQLSTRIEEAPLYCTRICISN